MDRGLASSRSSRSLARRSRSFSIFSGLPVAVLGWAPSPVNAPASRARRQSTRCEEYRPSRRGQRPLRARFGRVVLGQDRQLVLGGEASPAGPRGLGRVAGSVSAPATRPWVITSVWLIG